MSYVSSLCTPRILNCAILCGALLFSLMLPGCGGGGGGPKLYKTSGQVTFDGAPVETGRILFRMTSGDQKAYAAEITNGEYTIETLPGEASVEITASRIIPGKFDTSNPDDEPQPIGEMYIPAKYNSQTTLKATVAENNNNSTPFALTSE